MIGLFCKKKNKKQNKTKKKQPGDIPEGFTNVPVWSMNVSIWSTNFVIWIANPETVFFLIFTYIANKLFIVSGIYFHTTLGIGPPPNYSNFINDPDPV